MIQRRIFLRSTIAAFFFMNHSAYGIRGTQTMFKATEKMEVLCKGMPKSDYCDCSGDCGNHQGFCECEEAQECCENATPTVLCPDMTESDYCDCSGDCGNHQGFCECEEAQECCENAAPTVLCPGMSESDYCDCSGDCDNHQDFCECEEAKECCEKRANDDD